MFECVCFHSGVDDQSQASNKQLQGSMELHEYFSKLIMFFIAFKHNNYSF